MSHRQPNTENVRPHACEGFTFIELLITAVIVGIVGTVGVHAYMQVTQRIAPEASAVTTTAVEEPPIHIEQLVSGALYVWGEGTVLVRCDEPDCIPALNAFFDKYRNCDVIGGIPYSGAPQGWVVRKGYIFFVRNPLGCPVVPGCP